MKCGLAVQKTQLPASETIFLTPASINHECYHGEWRRRLKESLGITSDKRTLIITGITERRTRQRCGGPSPNDLHEALPQLSSGPPARTIPEASGHAKNRILPMKENSHIKMATISPLRMCKGNVHSYCVLRLLRMSREFSCDKAKRSGRTLNLNNTRYTVSSYDWSHCINTRKCSVNNIFCCLNIMSLHRNN